MKLRDIPNHHAVLVVHHDRQELGVSLWDELNTGPSMHKFVNQAVLDIDTAREIIAWANSPYNNERIAIISFHTASLPAQNAMLKILEEPKAGVRFILVTSNREHLIDTVISRTHLFIPEAGGNTDVLVREFLQTKPVSRIKLKSITALLAQEDEGGRKDRESVRSFILGLAEEISKDKKIPKKYVKETLAMASFTGDPSVTVKYIIEYLSLLLPKCDTLS